MAFDFDEGGALITPKASSSKSGFDFDESGLPVSAKPIEKSPGLIDTVIGTLKEVPNTVSSMFKEDPAKMYERSNAASKANLAAQTGKATPDLVTNDNTFGSDVSRSLGKATLKVPGALASTADVLIGGGELNTDSPIGVLMSLPGFAIKKATGSATPFRDASGYWGDVTGFKPGEAAKYVEGEEMKSGLSVETQTQKKATEKAWEESKTDNFAIKLIDFVSGGKSTAADVKDAWSKADMSYVAQALIDNPRVPLLTVIESVPSIVAGGGMSRATSVLALKSGLKLPGYMAGAVGEGMITSGMTVDELVDKGVPRERALEAGRWAGAITGGISGASGKLAGKLGLEDIDSLMAGKATEKIASRIPVSTKVIGGLVQEGAEEGVQSAQETMWQNWAEKNPIGKGVIRSAVEGAIAGSMMGAGSNVYGGIKDMATGRPVVTPESPPPITPAAQTEQQIQSEQSNTDDLLAQVKALHPEHAAETIQAQPDVDSAIQAAKIATEHPPAASTSAGLISQIGETTNAEKTAEAITLETKQPEAPAAGLIGREANGIQPERANAEMVTPGAEVGRDVLPGSRPVEQATMPGGTGGGIQSAEVPSSSGGTAATLRNVEQPQAVTDIKRLQEERDAAIANRHNVRKRIAEAKTDLERADARNDLDAIYDASVKLDAAVTQEVERKANAGEMSVFKGKNMTYAIHPATDGSGKWQVTRYSEAGALGDSRHETIKGAVKYEELSKYELLEGKEAEAELARVGRAEGEYQQRKTLVSTLPTTDGKQPAARRIQDPHELGQSVFTGKAKAVGLTDKQIEALLPEEPRDSVTGFFRAENKVPTVERAQKHSAETGIPTQFVDVDIANLGGINKRFKNNHAKANKFYRMLSDIAHEEMSKVGDQIIPIRHGGDEFSFVIANGTKESIDKARDRIKNRVKQLAVESGLDTEPHTKPGQPPGIGLHIGYAEIRENETLDDVFARAALGVDESKTGAGYVTKEEGRDATEVLRDERPAGTGEAQAAIPGRVRTEGQGTPGTNGEAQGGTGSADDVASAFTFNNDGTLKVEGHDKAFLKKVAKKLGAQVVFKRDGSAVFGKNTNQDKLDSILKNGIQVDAAKSAAAKARMNAGVDSSKDSLFTAIAKLGGLNKAEARSTWGLDKADRFNSGVLGKQVLVDGGESLDGMRELLVERGYLRDDDSLADFEAMFRNEQQGNKQYTDAAIERMAEESHREQMANEGAAALGIRGTNKGKRTVEIVEREIEKILSERTAQERESIAALERVPAEELIAEFDLPPIEAYQHESRIEGIDRGEETVGTHPEEPAQETGAGRNAPEGVEGGEGFALEGQTEAEAIAERNRLRDIENQPQVAETAAKKADDEKAKADERARVLAAHEADRDNFFGQNAREAADPNKPLFSRGVEPSRTPKEIAKDRNELKSIFEGLGRSLGTASKKAKEAAADHPKSEIINHIQDNFYDILAKMEDAGKVEINC